MADDRLPCCRAESIAATRSDKVMARPPAISFNPLQNASSRLTLVLCPATTMERLTTEDFMNTPPFVAVGLHLNKKFVLHCDGHKRILGRCKNHTDLRSNGMWLVKKSAPTEPKSDAL